MTISANLYIKIFTVNLESGIARLFIPIFKTQKYIEVMSSEILAVLEYMEKEKGISREDMIATIESAVKLLRRGVNGSGDVQVEIDPKNGAMQAWTQLRWWSRFPIRPRDPFG